MNTCKLAEVASINPRDHRSLNPDTEVAFVPLSDLDAEHGVAGPGSLRPYHEVGRGYTSFLNGDLLIAKITPSFENGKIGQARLRRHVGMGSTEFHVVRPHAEVLDSRYLLHYLRQPWVRTSGALRMTGSAGQRRVPAAFLAGLDVPLPGISEQRRIAAILDHADGLRAKRRQSLSLLDDLRVSTFLSMFGSPVDNPRDLPRENIGAIAQVKTGNSPSRLSADNFGDSIEWIKSNNLGSYVASRASEGLSEKGRDGAQIVPAGSILVTCIAGSAGSIGKASLVDREVAFNQQINAILPNDRFIPEFLLGQLWAAPELVREKSTGGMKGLVSKSTFAAIRLLAPSIGEQRAYVEQLRAVLAQRHLEMRWAEGLNDLLSSLSTRAFNGSL